MPARKTTAKKRTAPKKVVKGFVVSDENHENGKFVATSAEAIEWINSKIKASTSRWNYGSPEDYHCYAIKPDGSLQCCTIVTGLVDIKLPSTLKEA